MPSNGNVETACPGCGDPSTNHDEGKRVNVYLGGCGFNCFPSVSVLVDLHLRGFCIHSIHAISGSTFPALWFYKNLACGELRQGLSLSDIELMLNSSMCKFPPMTMFSIKFGTVRKFVVNEILGFGEKTQASWDEAVSRYYSKRLHLYRRDALSLMKCNVVSEFPTLDVLLSHVTEAITIPGLTVTIPLSKYVDAGWFSRPFERPFDNPHPRIVFEVLPRSVREALAVLSASCAARVGIATSRPIPNEHLGFSANDETYCCILRGTIVYI